MSVKVFLDSNILIYSYSSNDKEKRYISRKLMSENNSFISTQVLQELGNIVTRKFKFSYAEAQMAISECSQNNNIHINTEHTILKGCQVAERYGFSFYDSLIIAAALESNCDILYSEDLQDSQLIDNRLKIQNPYLYLS